ncbi:hypothetical protein [Flagellimonas sp.]|uniref:hypothetical protein n=1 Tax=Flagellimonas sp. TaxID=2058762 RepID=UPI003B50A6B8
MKLSLLTLALFLSINCFSQENLEHVGMFVRVFDLQGNKIAKGKIQSITANELQLQTRKLSIKLPVNNIGKIKTGRSGGTNVGIGAMIGAFIGGISGNNDGLYGASTGESIVIVGVAGAIMGSAAGGLSTIFKKNQKFRIDGDAEKWKIFVETITP